MATLKPATTYEQQLNILRQRNVIIRDEKQCLYALEHINYYRLTAYLLPFKQTNDTYLPGTELDTAYKLYEFDRHLRILMLTAIEEIEIFFRSKLAYFHSHNYGPEGYMDPANFSTHHDHQKFVDNFNREVKSNSQSLIVKHHLQQYQGHFPLWAAVEFFSFGMISRFYSDLTTKDQKILSINMYGNNYYVGVRSWLKCCTDLRNISAHYGRLYFRVFPSVPAKAPGSNSQNSRLFGAIFALKSLYPDSDKWNRDILPQIKAQIDSNKHVSLDHIGFPTDWEKFLKK